MHGIFLIFLMALITDLNIFTYIEAIEHLIAV